MKPAFDKHMWRKMGDLGWLGMLVPEDRGGLGLDIRDMCIVAHELGKWLAPEPVVASLMLALGILWRGERTRFNVELLQSAMAGERVLAVAWQERATDIEHCSTNLTRATRSSTGIVLNGEKFFAVGASGADGFIVSAKGADGLELYWLPRDTPGVNVALNTLADGGFAGNLVLVDVRIPVDWRVDRGEHAEASLRAAIDDALLVQSSELLGIMDGALQKTVEYLRSRVQFDRPIGSFQALQHRAVNLWMMKELASCALHDGIEVFERSSDVRRRRAAARRAKYRTSKSAIEITRDAIQLHGAIGFADECDIGHYLKRAIVLSSWLGNSAAQLRHFARSSEGQWVP